MNGLLNRAACASKKDFFKLCHMLNYDILKRKREREREDVTFIYKIY